ncbi:unnamed protein product [Ilex paraguariensis]|uniref:Uncharacterized protein n=1 Tax=Ilex paraguariensis TaxID=185542 RepID=A0ABC8RLR9_9AQUA
MRGSHLQTPQKEHLVPIPRSKSLSDYNTKHQKISKCLNSVSTSVSEDVLLESPKDSIKSSSTSEVCVDNQLGDSPEISKCLDSVSTSVSEDVMFESPKDSVKSSLTLEACVDNQLADSPESLATPLNPDLSPLSKTISVFDVTPLSSTITTHEVEANSRSVSVSCVGLGKSTCVRISSVEEEMLVNLIREARTQVLNSNDVALRSKKLLDRLVKFMIEDFQCLPEERDWINELPLKKCRVVLLSFVLWILAVLMLFSFSSDGQGSLYGPPPT